MQDRMIDFNPEDSELQKLAGKNQLYKQPTPASGEKIDVRRRKLGAVTIYDVTEAELTILEKGTEASIWLNFFIGTVSIAVSFLVTVLSVEWYKTTVSLTQIVFICITIIMFLSAIVCFVFWIRGRGQHRETIKNIRERTIQENC